MIITRYVLKEVAFTVIAVTGVLFLIYISNRFVRYLAEAASGKLTTDVVVNLLMLKSITSLPLLLPMSLYLAVIVALGRFYKDSEVTAMAACGIGLGALLRSVSIIALVFAGIVAYVSFYGSPWAQTQTVELKAKAEASADFVGISSGRFKEAKDFNLVFYAEHISSDQRVMNNVFAQREQDGVTHVLLATKAHQRIDPVSGERFLVFTDGYRYEGAPGNPEFKIVRFAEHGLRVQLPKRGEIQSRRSAKPTKSLFGSSDPEDVAELHWRLSMPISALLLTLMAVALSRSDPRQGRFAKLFAAILLYIAYSNLLGVGRAWIENGVVPLWFGLWWVHILVILSFAVLWMRQMGVRWTLRRIMRVSA